MTSFLSNHAAMFLGPWACGSECCSSNSNAPDISQKGLIGIQSHHSREKMSKKAREKPAEAGSASVSPYGSVLDYELVTSQPNRLINLIWPECRTWFIGPWFEVRDSWVSHRQRKLVVILDYIIKKSALAGFSPHAREGKVKILTSGERTEVGIDMKMRGKSLWFPSDMNFVQ